MARDSYRVVPAQNGFIIMRGDLFSRDGSLDQQWVAASAPDAGALLTCLLVEGTAPGEGPVPQQMSMAPASGPQAGSDVAFREALRHQPGQMLLRYTLLHPRMQQGMRNTDLRDAEVRDTKQEPG
jgi:hypothetical protein